MKLNVGISMDEIVQLPGPWVKLRPEEARLKWLFGAVRLTSVFSGTAITADAAMDSYKRSAAASAHRTSVDPNASTSRSGRRLGPLDLGPSPGQATERRYGGTANEPVRPQSDYRAADNPIAARSIGSHPVRRQCREVAWRLASLKASRSLRGNEICAL